MYNYLFISMNNILSERTRSAVRGRPEIIIAGNATYTIPQLVFMGRKLQCLNQVQMEEICR